MDENKKKRKELYLSALRPPPQTMSFRTKTLKPKNQSETKATLHHSKPFHTNQDQSQAFITMHDTILYQDMKKLIKRTATQIVLETHLCSFCCKGILKSKPSLLQASPMGPRACVLSICFCHCIFY